MKPPAPCTFIFLQMSEIDERDTAANGDFLPHGPRHTRFRRLNSVSHATHRTAHRMPAPPAQTRLALSETCGARRAKSEEGIYIVGQVSGPLATACRSSAGRQCIDGSSLSPASVSGLPEQFRGDCDGSERRCSSGGYSPSMLERAKYRPATYAVTIHVLVDRRYCSCRPDADVHKSLAVVLVFAAKAGSSKAVLSGHCEKDGTQNAEGFVRRTEHRTQRNLLVS